MKVAHVVRQYLPSVGGMEEVVRNLVAYQAKIGRYEPSVITLDRVFREPSRSLAADEIVEGIPVHRLPYSGSEKYPLCPQVLKSVADFDVLHIHGIDFFFDFLAYSKVLHRKPLIASTHGGFFHTQYAQKLKKIFFHTVTRSSCKSFQRIIATSNNDGDIFSQISRPPRLTTIENGVDVEKFHDTSSHELKPTIVYFGRWSVNKGLIESLKVFSALCTQQSDVPWHFTIAGREYDLTAQQLQAIALELGVAERVTIHANPSNAEITSLLGTASYFICLSKHEGFGIAPIEAMSAGLLPLLSDIPPFEQLVRNSGVGLLLRSSSSEAQAALIADTHTQAASGSAGPYATTRAKIIAASSIYSWDKVGAKYTTEYDQVLAGVSRR